MSLLDQQFFENFDFDGFRSTRPFPYTGFTGMINPENFEKLYAEFPDASQFRHAVGGERYPQKPHTREMIFLDWPLLGIRFAQKGWYTDSSFLSPLWKELIHEFRTSPLYRRFVCKAFGVSFFSIRFEWHLISPGTDICAHLDTGWRLGDHLFYFHRPGEWQPSWGGNLEILGDKIGDSENPGFNEFRQREVIPLHSVQGALIKNTPNAWHGVSQINCPPGQFRRVFLVNLGYPIHFFRTRLSRALRRRFRPPF